MTAPITLLLPGLDGTADLFEPFIASAPAGIQLKPVPLADTGSQSYRRLADHVAQGLPPGPVHVIAESFSGPLAILLAREHRAVKSVVLCATFVRPPVPKLFNQLPDWLLGRSPPTALVAAFMSGGNWKAARTLTRAVSRVDGTILTDRIRELSRVDVTAELSELTIPILCIRATKDRLIPAQTAAQIQHANPSCRMLDVDAPHLVLQTRPIEAWTHIKPFLDEVVAATS